MWLLQTVRRVWAGTTCDVKTSSTLRAFQVQHYIRQARIRTSPGLPRQAQQTVSLQHQRPYNIGPILGERFWHIIPAGSRLQQLPDQVLECIVARAGRDAANAAAACRDLHDAFHRALLLPEGVSTYLVARFGRRAACGLYASPQLTHKLLRHLAFADEGSKAKAVLQCVTRQIGGAPGCLIRHSPRLLTAAAASGHLPVLQYLAEVGVDPNAGGPDPLVAAVRAGRVDSLQLLLGAGADAATHGRTALTEAARLGCAPALELLLQAGVPDASGLGLGLASRQGQVDILRRLLPVALARPPPVAQQQLQRAAQFAAAGGQEEALDVLLAALRGLLAAGGVDEMWVMGQVWFEATCAALFCRRPALLRRQLSLARDGMEALLQVLPPGFLRWWRRQSLRVTYSNVCMFGLVPAAVVAPNWGAIPVLMRECHPMTLYCASLLAVRACAKGAGSVAFEVCCMGCAALVVCRWLGWPAQRLLRM